MWRARNNNKIAARVVHKKVAQDREKQEWFASQVSC